MFNFKFYHVQKEWPEGYQLATSMNFRFPEFTQIPLETIVANSGSDGIAMLLDMLKWNPSRRPTASQSLKYNYFKVNQKLGAQQITNASAIRSHRSAALFQRSQPWEMDDHVSHDAINNGNYGAIADGKIDYVGHNQSNQMSSHSHLKSGMSIKDQYLARTRYIAGQPTKNAIFRGSGNNDLKH